jgi:hypothetical protein
MTFLVKVKVTLWVGVTERVNVPGENERGSEGSDSDNTSNGGAATWVKVDKMPAYIRTVYWKSGGETNSIGPNKSF